MKKAFAQLHIAVFLAGFTAILGKIIQLNEILLVGIRMAITFLSLVFIQKFTKKSLRITKSQLFPLLGTGAIIALHWLSFYGSVKYGNVSIAVVCIAGSGFFTALLEPLLFRSRWVPVEIILGIIAIAGIYIIFDFHPQYKTGIIFGIFSAVGSSLFPMINKRLLLSVSPQKMVCYEMLGGLIILAIILPIYLYFFPAQYYIPTAKDWVGLLVLVWLCTVYTFHLQLQALKILSPFTANLTYNLEPVYGIILAFIFFKENKDINFYFYVGIMLILFSVFLQMYRVYLQKK